MAYESLNEWSKISITKFTTLKTEMVRMRFINWLVRLSDRHLKLNSLVCTSRFDVSANAGAANTKDEIFECVAAWWALVCLCMRFSKYYIAIILLFWTALFETCVCAVHTSYIDFGSPLRIFNSLIKHSELYEFMWFAADLVYDEWRVRVRVRRAYKAIQPNNEAGLHYCVCSYVTLSL